MFVQMPRAILREDLCIASGRNPDENSAVGSAALVARNWFLVASSGSIQV